MNAESACLKKLRKSFTSVKDQLSCWDSTVDHSRGILESLSNLVLQLQACDKTSFDREPLAQFTDLKQKLKYKLITSLEHVMGILRKDLHSLEEVTRRLAQHKESCFEVYNGHADALGIDKAVQGTPTRPSIAECLEWMVDIERCYRELYDEREELLDCVRYDDLTTIQRLQRSYRKQGNVYRVEALMEKVALFLSAGSNEGGS